MQMAPQAIKHMFSWGMEGDIRAASCIPTAMKVRQGASGGVIGEIGIGGFDKEYGAPYLVIHRAVLLDILHQHALKAGVNVLTNSRVTDYSFATGKITLADGITRAVGLVIGADGINSFARS